MHIGSQITDHGALRERLLAARRNWSTTSAADGHAITHVDVGGGLGIPYHHDEAAPPDPRAYAEVVKRHVAPLGLSLVIEPGG
jgi:diaminopimelate decarboxylase